MYDRRSLDPVTKRPLTHALGIPLQRVRDCDGSGVRVTLTAGEARHKTVACEHCKRDLRVRVARDDRGYEATLPRHKPVAA